MSKAPTPKTTFAFVPSSSLWGKILPTFQSLRQYRHGHYCTKNGGDEGSRTPDLYVANVPLSHLSYIPTAKTAAKKSFNTFANRLSCYNKHFSNINQSICVSYKLFDFMDESGKNNSCAPVAQVDRAPDS